MRNKKNRRKQEFAFPGPTALSFVSSIVPSMESAPAAPPRPAAAGTGTGGKNSCPTCCVTFSTADALLDHIQRAKCEKPTPDSAPFPLFASLFPVEEDDEPSSNLVHYASFAEARAESRVLRALTGTYSPLVVTYFACTVFYVYALRLSLVSWLLAWTALLLIAGRLTSRIGNAVERIATPDEDGYSVLNDLIQLAFYFGNEFVSFLNDALFFVDMRKTIGLLTTLWLLSMFAK